MAGGWGYVRLKDLGLVLSPGRGPKTRAFKGYVRMYRRAGGYMRIEFIVFSLLLRLLGGIRGSMSSQK